MNLKEFIELVDQKAKELNKEELLCFIHSIARKVSEGKRKEFSELLEDIVNCKNSSSEGIDHKTSVRIMDEKEIRKEFDRLKNMFASIEAGELYIYAEGYEDYSDGYWGDNWVWEFDDPDRVCAAYVDACLLIERCANDGFYEEAVEMFDLLIETDVVVKNDLDDFFMELEELIDKELLSINLENLALYILYAVYQMSLPDMRAQSLYDYFSIPFFREIKLEKMISLGSEELEGLSDFWDSWIDLLKEKNGDMEARMLKEAVLYQRGEGGMLEIARLAYEKHPSLYLEVLENYQNYYDNVELLEIGKEALEKIEKKYVLRSEIALNTAEAALSLDEEAYVVNYWLEAFLSNTTPLNCLRVMAESNNPTNYQKTIESIVLSAKYGKCNISVLDNYGSYNQDKELEENYVPECNKAILRFLTGDFEFAMKECCKVREPLGWTGKFIKCGLPLFLLLLLKEDNMKQGCSKMAKNLMRDLKFDSKEYFKGTKYQTEYGKDGIAFLKEEDVFWQSFSRWKAGYSISEEIVQIYLMKLEKIIDKRVRVIVSGQYRNHYRSVAELAAALGEVMESRGEVSAKENILQKYKAEFPRHSSFHGELRENGMKDDRKKKKK